MTEPFHGALPYGSLAAAQAVSDIADLLALDRPSLDVIETFPGFDAMLARVLRDAFET